MKILIFQKLYVYLYHNKKNINFKNKKNMVNFLAKCFIYPIAFPIGFFKGLFGL